jgi:hypothetical protein
LLGGWGHVAWREDKCIRSFGLETGGLRVYWNTWAKKGEYY